MNNQFITRFAPSPTGYLHIGNLRTALIAWLAARQNKGTFILRLDDTDKERSDEKYTIQIKKDLLACGLSWDEEFNQLSRVDRYKVLCDKLIASGRLYPCYETTEELDLQRKLANKLNKPFIYNASSKGTSKKPYWRFKLNRDEMISWNDYVKGEIKFNPAQISDPVVIRADGSFTYLLISVIDDIDSNVNFIIRGEDHISNTASQIQMWKALDAEVPEFAHLALLKMPEGKISKRIGGFEIFELLNEGILPLTLLNYLCRLGSSKNIANFSSSLDELIEDFDIKSFSSSSPNFSKEELLMLNAKILQSIPYSDINIDVKEDLWEIIKCNVSCYKDISHWQKICYSIFIPCDVDCALASSGLEYLPNEPWDEKTWSNWISIISKNNPQFSKKELFVGLRKILTEKEHGPEMGKLINLIGRTRVVQLLTHHL